jgi:hypothetical protein
VNLLEHLKIREPNRAVFYSWLEFRCWVQHEELKPGALLETNLSKTHLCVSPSIHITQCRFLSKPAWVPPSILRFCIESGLSRTATLSVQVDYNKKSSVWHHESTNQVVRFRHERAERGRIRCNLNLIRCDD